MLTVILILVYVLCRSHMTYDERRLYAKVESAQKFLWSELEARGLERDEESDPNHSGFIGVEYSPITTTLGSLKSKQCSTDPLWSVQFMRWLRELGLSPGDTVFISSSSSFPGILYSAVAACEYLGLEVRLCVSLGSSTWGANRPGFTCSMMLDALRSGGFMKARPELYTLGGENENAGNMPEEGREILEGSLSSHDTLLTRNTLQEIINIKAKLIPGSKVFVNIGGNASSMGLDSMSLNLPPGLVRPESGIDGGDGLAGLALRSGIPVIHILNLKRLADECGIDFNERRGDFKRGNSLSGGIISFAVFSFFMITHKRWTYQNWP